jgi:diguanylate cyclase (GGDEF)-like protein
MKNKMIRKMYLALIVAVLAVAASVFSITYTMSLRAIAGDIRLRTEGVGDYVLELLREHNIGDISEHSENGIAIRNILADTLNRFQPTTSLKQLYIARIDGNGIVQTTLDSASGGVIPSGQQLKDLERSVREVQTVSSSGIYRMEHGSIYSTFMPVINATGTVLGVVCIEYDASDIADSYRLMSLYSLGMSLSAIILFSLLAYLSMSRTTENAYKILAYIDLLTGYENRTAFEQQLRECDSCCRDVKSIAIMVFDLNHLKRVNDTLGHKAGDELIKNTADRIAHHLGDRNLLYRIGGDEFAAIIKDRSYTELQKVVNSIRSDRRDVIKDFPFSCAVGMSRYNQSEDRSVREALERADIAMYEDKKRRKSNDQKQLEIDKPEKDNIEKLRDKVQEERLEKERHAEIS